MVDAFDFGAFDADAFDFDVAGFDGLGFGHLTDIPGFDPTAALVDGMGLSSVEGLDDLDAGALELDLSFDSIGFGSDLDDVLFAPDPGQLIDLELAGTVDIDLPEADVSTPGEFLSMSPAAAIGPGQLASPFLPHAAGGAAVMGGVGATQPSVLLPPGMATARTDTYVFPVRAAANVTTKVLPWLARKGREIADDMAKQAITDQIRDGATALLGLIRRADEATQSGDGTGSDTTAPGS